MNESHVRPLTVRQAALAAALLYFLLIGGTTAGMYITAFAALNAVIATALIGIWVIELPRHNDLTDRLLLVALLAFLLTCVTSAFPRMSFEAATSLMAATAAFGIARGELASMRPERVMITVLALSGLVLSIGFLALWIPYWVSWWRGTGAAPPLDLPLPPGHYWHFHFAAMLLALLLPAALQLRARKGARVIAVAASFGAIAVVAMSGARTAWVALIAVFIAAVALKVRLRAAIVLWIGGSLAGLVAILALTGAFANVGSRLLNGFTVAIRTETWTSSLAVWLDRPLTGWGPGSFPAVFRFSQTLPTVPDPGSDAQNVVVQVLLESGLIGLAALIVACAAIVVGIRRSERRSPYALAGLATVGLMSLTDLPSSFPVLFVVGIAWASLSAPRRQLADAPMEHQRSVWRRLLPAALGAGIVLAVASTLVARTAFDDARLRVENGDLAGARQSLATAVAFDPSMALFWRERGTRAAQAGDGVKARTYLERAYALDPGDTTTLRALAVLAVDDDRLDDAIRLARSAVKVRATDPQNNLLLAWVATRAGDDHLAVQAQSNALTWSPWLAAAPTWARLFGPVSTAELRQATKEWEAAAPDGQRTWEATWLRGMTSAEPTVGLTPTLAAVDAILRCDLTRAAGLLSDAGNAVDDQAWLAARLMLSRLTGDADAYRAAGKVAALRRNELALPASSDPGPETPFADSDEDIRLYKTLPLAPAELEPLLPTQAEGLMVWLQDPGRAARIGAPGSRLAMCEGEQ